VSQLLHENEKDWAPTIMITKDGGTNKVQLQVQCSIYIFLNKQFICNLKHKRIFIIHAYV
jgi:hypothetical protein